MCGVVERPREQGRLEEADVIENGADIFAAGWRRRDGLPRVRAVGGHGGMQGMLGEPGGFPNCLRDPSPSTRRRRAGQPSETGPFLFHAAVSPITIPTTCLSPRFLKHGQCGRDDSRNARTAATRSRASGRATGYHRRRHACGGCQATTQEPYPEHRRDLQDARNFEADVLPLSRQTRRQPAER